MVSTKHDSVYSKGFPYEPIQKQYVVSKNAVFNSMNELLFVPILSDTIYHIKSFDEYCIRYVIKHNRSIWNKHNEELSYNETRNLIKRDGYTVFRDPFYETSKYAFFSMEKKKGDVVPIVYYLYDKGRKQTYELSGEEVKVITDVVPPNVIALDGEACVSSFDACSFKELFLRNNKELSLKNDVLKTIIDKSDENSNPVLVFYQLK